MVFIAVIAKHGLSLSLKVALPGSLITVLTSSKSTLDQAGGVDDAADGVLEHVVGKRKRLFLGDVVAHHLQQLFSQDDDQAQAKG